MSLCKAGDKGVTLEEVKLWIHTGDDRITLHGNRKYGTKHNEFHCNECGYTADRDAKVPATLMRYSDYTMKHIRKLQHKQATVINGLA